MKTISQEEYYLTLAYYLVSCKAQAEVRKYQGMISDTLKDAEAVDSLSDAIYDPLNRESKKEYDEILFQSGITIEWKEIKKK